jgi:hypothetical protein
MQAGVEDALSRVAGRDGGWRGVTRTALLATLCAGALAPVAATAAGVGALAVAVSAVVGSVGGNILTTMVQNTVDRLRRDHGHTDLSVVEIERALVLQVDAALVGDSDRARRLREEIAVLLRAVGAPRVAIQAAAQAGDEEVGSLLVAALRELGADFTDDLRVIVNELRQDIRLQVDQQRHEVDLRRHQSVQLGLIVDRLDRLDRVAVAGAQTEVRRWDRPPYLGLEPFHQDQQQVFYGRDQVTAELTAKWPNG